MSSVTRHVGLVVFVAVFSCSSKSGEDKIREKQRSLDAAREKKKAEDASQKAEAAKPEAPVALDALWQDPTYVTLVPDGKCPDGIWALFDQTPGSTPAEKKENAKKRPELAQSLKSKTFLVKLRAPDQVALSDYDAPKGEFRLDVLSHIDCEDSAGHLTIAWGNAKAEATPTSAIQEGAEITQRMWTAPPTQFSLPMRSMQDAKEYAQKNKLALSARVVFQFQKTDVDHHMFKTTKVQDKDVSIGGGNEDWGAGRLIRAKLVGLRVATDREQTTVVEKRP